MNITIFNWKDIRHPEAGGAELYLHEQAKRWISKGNRVNWITSKPNGLKDEEEIDGIKIFRQGNKLTSFIFAPINYIKKIRESDVIIDSENGIPFFTPLFSKGKNILVIYHFHNHVWEEEYKFPISFIGRVIECVFMPKVYRKSRIVTISESTKNDLNKIFSKNKIDIVYCGVDNNLRKGKKSKNPEITYLGRIKKYKSIDVFLKAVSIVDKNLRVNIVGKGDYESEIKKLSKKLGLKNVKFYGFVKETEKREILQRSHFMVNPSYIEGWGITNIEANACGTIVIGSNVRGIRDSIIDNKTGILFQYGNVKELGEKIKFLLNNNEYRVTLERNALKRAKEFNWEKSSDKLLKIMSGNKK